VEQLVLCTDGEDLPENLARKLFAQGICVKPERMAWLEGIDGCLKTIRFDDGSSPT
jgi:hypothetical protein